MELFFCGFHPRCSLSWRFFLLFQFHSGLLMGQMQVPKLVRLHGLAFSLAETINCEMFYTHVCAWFILFSDFNYAQAHSRRAEESQCRLLQSNSVAVAIVDGLMRWKKVILFEITQFFGKYQKLSVSRVQMLAFYQATDMNTPLNTESFTKTLVVWWNWSNFITCVLILLLHLPYPNSRYLTF